MFELKIMCKRTVAGMIIMQHCDRYSNITVLIVKFADDAMKKVPNKYNDDLKNMIYGCIYLYWIQGISCISVLHLSYEPYVWKGKYHGVEHFVYLLHIPYLQIQSSISWLFYTSRKTHSLFYI